MTRSLQMRLLLGLALGTSFVLVASGLLLYALIRAELIAEFDATLASEAHALATLVEKKDGRIQTEMAEHGVPKFQPEKRPIYYAVWNGGRLVERSSGLASTSLAPFGGTLEQPVFRPVVLPDRRSGRMVGFHFTPHPYQLSDEDRTGDTGDQTGPDGGVLAGKAVALHSTVAQRSRRKSSLTDPLVVTMVVARDTLELDHTLQRIGMLLAGVFGGAVVVSLLLTAPIVRASLVPLKRISARIDTLDTPALTERLDSLNAPAEVRSVIDCLNGLLDRLQGAFQRERAFSANVAHELRTPLAGLRTTIDVALARPREAGDYRRSLEQCLAICKQATTLTENLLVLARLDARQIQPQREAIELDELLRRIWAPLADRAAARGLQVSWQLDGPIELYTDATLLTLILRNLLENAVSYADENGQMEILAHLSGATATIAVENAASVLPPDLAEHAFDRFWRANASRAGTGQHAGLGLSLCREAASVLGAKLTVTTQNGAFAVRLEF